MNEVEQKVRKFKSCMEKYLIREEDSVLLLDPNTKELQTGLDKVSGQLREGANKKP